ncbi:hypothetical protein CY35_16G002500 [Sphagnum magellanicum]|nr:hypothetical protein CY35_16G002500 [Sphagnum magellanicum]KAH9536496.1 hypothetical protein CY35_16G002500 [Sphagnum magellanicum]
MAGENLREIACVAQQRVNDAVSHVVFDPHLELIWTASSTGSLHSYLCPSLEKYTVFGAHSTAVLGLLAAAEGIVSLSSGCVRMHTRGGLSILNFRDKGFFDMLCCDWERPGAERPGAKRMLIGHTSAKISVLDLSTSCIATTFPAGQGIAVLRSNGRLVACGGMSGDIVLKDLRTMKAEHTIDAHPGKISSLDLKGDLLVSCGLAPRRGRVYCDSVIKVFDIRQQVRPLTNIPFAPGATTLRFQPKFSSIVLATSASGAFLLTDVQGGGIDFQGYQVNCDTDALLASDVSSSGELLGFGDSGGYVHVWGTSEHAHANLFSLPTELPGVSSTQSHISEQDSFTNVYIPGSSNTPFSAIDTSMPIRVGLPPRMVERVLLEQMSAVDFVGYVPNPHWRRGIPFGDASCAVAGLRNTRQIWKATSKEQTAANQWSTLSGVTSQLRVSGSKRLPKAYRRVEIKQSQSKLKFEEFDFSYYNKTRFAGLENDIINSYCNALLQVLYFIPKLQASVTSHVCEREFCLTCELGFVLHMLQLARGSTCQPSNLLRALCQIREASALGLVEGLEEWENGKEKSLAKRIQNFSWFLLEQLHKEWGGTTGLESCSPSPAASISDQLFGMPFRVRSKCRGGSHNEVVQDRLSFQVNLQYPTGKSGSARPLFAELLERSLCKQEDMRAWCPHCRAYVPLQQVRLPCSLPSILIIDCCIRRESDLYFWNADGDHNDAVSNSTSARIKGVQSGLMSPANQTGSNWWLPFRIEITIDSLTSRVTVSEERSAYGDGASDNEIKHKKSADAEGTAVSHAVYELTAMIAHIHDDFENDRLFHDEGEGHLVAHIKVPDMYLEMHGWHALPSQVQAVSPSMTSNVLQHEPAAAAAMRGAPASQSDWVLFNDFCIAPTSTSEVVTLYGKQKVPCLLYYTQLQERIMENNTSANVSESSPDSSATLVKSSSQPISDEIFKHLVSESASFRKLSASNDISSTFWPFDMTTEAPKPGLLLGIDAEFVALSASEKGSREDGVEFVKRPARLSLARVSVVRGEGDKAGVCCIDDYICMVEPVYDYLTRYSGVSPGDLDPATSNHPVTNLKKAYLKLRYLVDKGCRFVGHGLKKDFRMINIVVPQDQIIDTVELFHLKRQRMLSLRFLASYLLNVTIQKETHDSIEDACTWVMYRLSGCMRSTSSWWLQENFMTSSWRSIGMVGGMVGKSPMT